MFRKTFQICVINHVTFLIQRLVDLGFYFTPQNEKLEEKIMEYHKTLSGYNPAEAERRFLNLARSQDLYGVDPHPCKVSVSFTCRRW